MTLVEFKNYIESFPTETKFKNGISEPFSWRGSYDEVAFSIEYPMSREEILKHITNAYQNTFQGYKGGEYKYNDGTLVNFESGHSSYSDGGYVEEKISELEGYDYSQEQRLIYLAFN